MTRDNGSAEWADRMTFDEAVALAIRLGCDRIEYWQGLTVLDHGQIVAQTAAAIAGRIAEQGHTVDVELARVGGLLHDVGRTRLEPGESSIVHVLRGGELLRAEGYEALARIAERHGQAGISQEEIERYDIPLPARDFLPETVEEKIVCYADKLGHEEIMAGTESMTGGFYPEEPIRARFAALEAELSALAGCDVRSTFVHLAKHTPRATAGA